MSDWYSADPIVEPAAGRPRITVRPKTSDMDPAHRDLAIRTIYGEAANEPDEGQAAVAAVIKNRMDAGRYGGNTIPGVVLAKSQFEPWGNNDARTRMMALKPDDPRYQKIGGIVDQVFGGQMEDPTGGATHFVAPQAQLALGRQMPSWAQGDGQAIGRHTFFAPEGRVQAKGGDWWANDPVEGQPSQPAQPAPVGANTEGLSNRVAREGMSDPALQVSAPGAFLSGAKQGATANFSDELAGVYAAGTAGLGLPPGARPSVIGTPIIGGARLGYEYLTGKRGEATAAYEAARDQARAEAKAAAEQHPGMNLAGNLAGGIAVPLGRAAQGATLVQRARSGAVAGGIIGGASGIGAGEDTAGRVGGGLLGGALGAPIGAAAPYAIEGVTRGARAIAQPIANTVRGVTNPEGEAARRVALSIHRDALADPNATTRLTPGEFGASVNNGGPAAIVDLGGETTRALARSAANTSPEARQALGNTLNTRFEGQAGRVTNWLNHTFNFPNAHAQQQALEETARVTNSVRYRQAYQDGAGGLWSPELERLAGADAVSGAMQRAAKNARDEGIVSGYGAMNPRITFNESGVMQTRRGPSGAPTYPDLQYWDLVRRELSDAARAALPGSSEARRLGHFATAMNAELDRLVPTYQQARQGAAHFFGAENMLEAGQNFVAQNFNNRAVRQQLANATPLERQLFQDGFASRYVESLERIGDRRSVTNHLMQSTAEREKVSIALGPQRAAELEAGIRTERIMDLARQAQGNSTTARQLTELGLAGGAYGLGTGFDVLNPSGGALASAALVYGAARGRGAINESLARRVGEMLASNNPQRLLQGVRIVARNQNMLTSLRRFDAALGKSGAQQGPANLPALQAAGAGRADDN